MVNVAKKTQVDSLLQTLAEHPHFALVRYEKTTHQVLEALRRELKKSDAHLKMVKNSLIEKALNKLSATQKELLEVRKNAFPLKDNSALLSLGEDYVAGLSAFFKATKTSEGLSFKLGVMEHKLYEKSALESLAKLPPKIELQANLIGMLRAPAQKLVSSLSFNMGKLVFVLSERGKQA